MEHRIADFGENVHILYVIEMAQNFRFLLLLWTFEIPKFSSIADVIYYGTAGAEGKNDGKLS